MHRRSLYRYYQQWPDYIRPDPMTNSTSRIEKDSMGEKAIPSVAYYGIQTLRAVENFPISGLKPLPTYVDACLLIKKAAAIANSSSPLLGDNLRQCLDEVPQGEFQGVTTFQVWRQGAIIGEVSSVDGTAQMVRSLQGIMAPGTLEASAITPVLGGEQPAIRLSSDVMLHIASHVGNDAKDSSAFSHEWAAIAWSDQLRQSLGAEPLDAGDVQTMLKGLQPSGQQLSGTASWYGPYFHGRLTANGETFDQNTLTAAHKTLPFNTVLQVRNLKNNRSVVVRINDRGPYIGKRSIDLSKAAAQCLGSEQAGVIPYEAVILEQLSAASEAN